jgi:hypothetical protein
MFSCVSIRCMKRICFPVTDRSQGVEYAEELETACRQIKNFVNNSGDGDERESSIGRNVRAEPAVL